MSKKTYMIIDLCFLSLFGCIAEVITILAIHMYGWNIQIISFQLLVTLLAMYRWNGYGVLVAIPLGITTFATLAILNGVNNVDNLLVYPLGNLGAASGLITFKIIGKKNIKKGFEFILIYCIIGYVGQVFLRTVFLTLVGSDFIESLKRFSLYGNLLGLIVVIILLTLISKMEGVFVEPIEYLKEQLKEKEDTYRFESKQYELNNGDISNIEDNIDKDVDSNE